jgi:hypothetical protein
MINTNHETVQQSRCFFSVPTSYITRKISIAKHKSCYNPTSRSQMSIKLISSRLRITKPISWLLVQIPNDCHQNHIKGICKHRCILGHLHLTQFPYRKKSDPVLTFSNIKVINCLAAWTCYYSTKQFDQEKETRPPRRSATATQVEKPYTPSSLIPRRRRAKTVRRPAAIVCMSELEDGLIQGKYTWGCWLAEHSRDISFTTRTKWYGDKGQPVLFIHYFKTSQNIDHWWW